MFEFLKQHKHYPQTPIYNQHKPILMVEIPMDELNALIDAVDKAVNVISSEQAEIVHLKAEIDNHVADAAAVAAQKAADEALAAQVKADTDGKLKAMADKLKSIFPPDAGGSVGGQPN